MSKYLVRVMAVWFAVVMLGAATGESQDSPAGNAVAGEAGGRPGLIRVGSTYLTPYLYIGTMGLDTNVFYTPTERQSDFFASGGPGLEVVRPLGAKEGSRIRLDGALDYLYYAKTEPLRRLNGHASALLELHGVKTDFVVEESYAQSFARPNYQVNDRVQSSTESTRGLLTRRLADRLQLALFGDRSRTRTESHDYLGTDLRLTTSEDRYRGGAEMRVALTVKTQFVVGGEENWYRFPYAPERDGASTAAFGGFRTDQSALIGGQAIAGVRWFRLDTGGTRHAFYADVDEAWRPSPKTTIGARYVHDLQYSVFNTSGETPTNTTETVEVYLDKMLSRTIYLRLYARAGWMLSDGAIAIETPDGPSVGVRDETAREAGAELGYQFRSRVRIGGTARYSKRQSTFSTFGIDGLTAGLTVTYNPPQPSFR